MDGARGSTLLKQEVGEEHVMLDVSSVPYKIVVRGGGIGVSLFDEPRIRSIAPATRIIDPDPPPYRRSSPLNQ